MDDASLVRSCLESRPGAWERFAARVVPVLRGAVRDVLGRFACTPRGEDPDDLVQELLLFLLESDGRRVRTWRGDAPLTAWVRSVAVRFTLNRLRGRRPVSRALDDMPFAEAEAEPPPFPPGLLNRALDSLEPRDRLILKMRHFDNLSYRSIARFLGIPVNTLCPMLVRARSRLRAAIARISAPEPEPQSARSEEE
jgi:RNA polymerase sigma-70 factor (ECF subfamily)